MPEETDPELTTPELVQQVFENKFGKALLVRWMKMAGLTDYQSQAKDHEALLRRDELQRFLFSIINALEFTPEQVYALSQRQAEHNNLIRQTTARQAIHTENYE